MCTIISIGRDQEARRFRYFIETEIMEGVNTWTFWVQPIDQELIESFEFRVNEVNAETAKVMMINRHDEAAYQAMGIPEALIEEASRILRRTIISSSNLSNAKIFKNERREHSATKIWLRLEADNRARYDEINDIYIYQTVL